MKHKLIIGLTGSFGTGKSTVAAMFRKLGAYVIDADRLAHRCMLPEQGIYKKIISIFGNEILGRNNKIKRSKLARLVFDDKKKLALLTSLIYPQVIKEIRRLLKNVKEKVIVIDAPMLLEAGLGNLVDRVIVLATDKKTQIARCIRKGFSKDNLAKRIQHQLPLSKKIKVADFIINNSKSRNCTKIQVKKIWEELNYVRK